MSRSDAEILWDTARVLARDAAEVSQARGGIAPSPPPMLFFTDPERTPEPWVVPDRLPAGSGVVYRAFGAATAGDTALRLRDTTRRRGVLLLIGLDAELAEACQADGVHLPESALDQRSHLAAARPDWLLTGAAHGEAALAECAGLSAAVVSPVFPAGGLSASRPALGVEGFRRLVETAPCPVIALSGINAQTAPSLIDSGACGLAAVGAIQSAFGPD